jgi:hypothetical protein
MGLEVIQPGRLFDPREISVLIDRFEVEKKMILIVSNDPEGAVRELAPVKKRSRAGLAELLWGRPSKKMCCI